MRQMALFSEERTIGNSEVDALQVKLSELRLERPRQWGACWLADSLWRQLELDLFFAERLGCSREQTEWEKVLRTMTIYRLISPGSEWRMHRHWFSTTALPDLLNVDERVAQPSTLYRCHDLLLEHKEALFAHLRERWINLFAAQYDILLYDLTSTYFECDAPEDENDPRSFKNKSVGQRMAIISAGVVMNVILGCVCFVIAYGAYCFLAVSCWQIKFLPLRIPALLGAAIPICAGYFMSTVGLLGLMFIVGDYTRAPESTEQIDMGLECRVTGWGMVASASGYTVHLYKSWSWLPFMERSAVSIPVVQIGYVGDQPPKDASCADAVAEYRR